MRKLDLDTKKINTIFISHDHWDHTGGLREILKENANVDVLVLPSFSENLKSNITVSGAHLKEDKSPNKICSHVYSTGTLGTAIEEQSLVIETEKGLVIITGCAHPGIVNIIKSVKDRLKQTVFLVFGGFHLGSYPLHDLKKIIEQFQHLGVEKAGPCHCSGVRCRELFANTYKKDFVNIGVGKVISVSGIE